ncbi:MAG TPA: prolyl oligopeptidase family serine peptidase [Gemmataceae bacterium]|jgi:dienelactone hydrolase|nr:prolyl oligopeptidase family serine peptidase [Gemmataceae bacterium]
MRKALPVLALAAFTPLLVFAQAPKPLPGDERIEAYLKQQTERLSGRFLDGAKTKEEWEARRPRLRREYLDMLGLWPLPERTPLHATVTGTVDRDGVVIEKLHYQSRPGLYVTANLYRPKEPKGKLPAVLYVCGHSGRGRDGNKTAFQDHGMWFAGNGYVCLIVDTLQLGEVAGNHHGTYNLGRWWWQSRGYTPAGVECWNGVRGLDYLVSRPDVDPNRLGVTGISGGGAATFWIAAADERVRCAVPVSGMSDLESYVSNKVINGHCDCMFLVNTYQWHWTTIAALVAPRPLLFANSDNDRIFPMDGNRRVMARLRKLYTMYGKPELVDEYVSKGGHDDRPDLRVAAFQWMNKHLKNDTAPVKHTESKPLPGPQLRVFPEDIPKDALNDKIDETFVPKAVVKLPEKGKFAEWKKGMLKELRERSFRPLPAPIPAAKREKRRFEVNGKKLDVDRIIPEPGIELDGGPVLAKGPIRALLVLGEEGLGEKDTWGQFVKGKNYWYLFVRGVAGEWTKKSPPNYVERAHALLGSTVDLGRVRDIAATAKYLKEKENADLTLIGVGQAGVLVAYAALFEPSIKEVILIDPPASHRDGPIFLNVLRVLDIPEALGLLAPDVKLTLVNAKDKAFDRTAQIYKLAGAADRLHRK